MEVIGAWLAAAWANKWVALLWRWKWWILGALGAAATAAYIGVLKLQLDHYRISAGKWQATAEQAELVNANNVKAYAALQAEKAATEKLLSDRLARKTADAKRLNALIDAIQAAEPSHACATSPAIGAVLDGLRQRSVP